MGICPPTVSKTTDFHGEIHISGVTGTVEVKETRIIEGYTIGPATQTQTVKVTPRDTQTLTSMRFVLA